MKQILLLIFPALLMAESFPVVHQRDLWRDEAGVIEINEQGITYMPAKGDQKHEWSYLDIQFFDRISPKEFVIVTYEDQRLLLGRDREYRFRITSGALDDQLFRSIARHMQRPVTDRVLPEEISAAYNLPVKHLHTFGGCEGELRFTADRIYYVTKHKEDTRDWLLARDVQSVWSDDPYQLELHVYGNNRREFSRTEVFKFDLKRPLDPEFYRRLKLELYALEAGGRVIR